MTFNKKNKRTITINDKIYYWSATGNDGWISLSIMTEVEGSPRLSCAFDYLQTPKKVETESGRELTFLTDQFVITPFTVRQVIEYAVSRGWRPFEKGKDLSLGYVDDKIDLKLDKFRVSNFKK